MRLKTHHFCAVVHNLVGLKGKKRDGKDVGTSENQAKDTVRYKGSTLAKHINRQGASWQRQQGIEHLGSTSQWIQLCDFFTLMGKEKSTSLLIF